MAKIIYLKNNIPVVLEYMPHSRSASVSICCKTGSKNDPKGQEGISHFVEHMLFRTTSNREAHEISGTIDQIGGVLNAFTTRELTVYYSSVLHKYADLAIDVLSDMVMNPLFKSSDISKEKKVILEELRRYNSNYEDLVHDVNLNNIFTDTPLGRNVLGSQESVSSISKKQLIDYYNKNYTPDNIFISVAGNFNELEVILQLNSLWESFNREHKAIDKVNSSLHLGDHFHSAQTEQVHICVNAEGLSYLSDEYYILQVIGHILGHGSSSRLFKEIRENRAIAYSVYSYLSAYSHTGILTTYISTSKDNYVEALDTSLSEYRKFKKRRVKHEELDKAKNQILSSLILDSESSAVTMFRNLQDYFSKRKITRMKEVEARVNEITRDDIIEFSRKHFSDYKSFTVLGDVN